MDYDKRLELAKELFLVMFAKNAVSRDMIDLELQIAFHTADKMLDWKDKPIDQIDVEMLMSKEKRRVNE